MSTAFTDTERAILRIVQFQLPDTLTPYADIAREVGTDEETVLNLLRRMKEDAPSAVSEPASNTRRPAGRTTRWSRGSSTRPTATP